MKGKNLKLCLDRIDVFSHWIFEVNFVCENSEWRIKGEGKVKKYAFKEKMK